MHHCKHTREKINDLDFNHPDNHIYPSLLDDLTSCQSCKDYYFSVKEALSAFHQVELFAMPDEAYWHRYEAALRTKLIQDKAANVMSRTWLRPSWMIPATLALMILVAGAWWGLRERPEVKIAAGKKDVVETISPLVNLAATDQSRPSPNRRKREPVKPAKPRKDDARPPGKKPYSLFDPVPFAEAAINTPDLSPLQLARHFEKAQLVLRSFRNTPASDDATFDLGYEKSRARLLLRENIKFRLIAEAKSDLATEDVLSNLELLLLDLANLSERPTADEIQPIKERMQKKEIVAALQIYTTSFASLDVEAD